MEDAVLALAGSPLLLVAVWALVTIDGVFPPIPSETVVVAAAVLSASTGRPLLLQLVLVAALGAFSGDLLAYTLGRRLPLRRSRLFRSARAQRSLDWAENALRTRGASFILTARFVPIGRVAVNMTAGATGFPARRFVPTAALAGFIWAIYTSALGVGAGSFLADQPLAAIAVGILIGSVVGGFLDAAVGRRAARALPRQVADDAALTPPVADPSPSAPGPQDPPGPQDRSRRRLEEGAE